ncbi:electron transfer flavoprotein subunit beta [Halomonas sp. HP20-15]|uniref:electron transfer flavoprotein subunit beta n=1 Tax=Halomonas sp. HP20-15 TaxID=3085901 RepID=UPI0029821E84|nr:electron transfer flavoprotein subunit beta [Halomonas sp. HP20-15]MDW5378328.1 electron transfer flavoprotein subunit beta [Halomonas sp. HP20-15]
MPPDASISQSGALDVAVLVSVGRHPLTARPRRADQDARAVELALGLAGTKMRLIHAGQHDADSDAALSGYLGMGVGEIALIEQEPGADVTVALIEALRAAPPQLLLAGSRAETGEGSGLLPYLLAETLGWPIVTGLAAIETVEAGTASVLQALPRGQRRRLRIRLPAVLCVDPAAPAPRQSAFGPARRGELTLEAQPSVADTAWAGWDVQPARPRPRRLKLVKAASARDRFKAAAAKAQGGGGRVLDEATPEQGAEAIFKLLKDEGVLR